MVSKYHLLINLYKNIIYLSNILQKNYNLTCAIWNQFQQVCLFGYAKGVFHSVCELLSSNLLSKLFLSKFYIFHFIFFLGTYFRDQFIDTINEIQCFTFIQ